MFVRSRSIAVRAFTPSALPNFFVIPALIPVRWSFCQSPSYGRPDILGVSDSTKNLSGLPGCFYISVLLDAVCDPGASGWRSSFPRLPPVACILYHGLGHPSCYFGANHRIQLPSLHLATFPQLRGSLFALGVEFPFPLFRLWTGS